MKQKKLNHPSPQAVKIKIGSLIVDIGHRPKEVQESMLKRLGVAPPQTSAEVVEVELPEELVRYARKKLATKKEYLLHTAKFGPPMLKEFAMLVLAAAGEACAESQSPPNGTVIEKGGRKTSRLKEGTYGNIENRR